MARPTKYTEENIGKAVDYLTEWRATGDVIPSQAGLAIYLEVSIACVENWGRDDTKQEFLRVLDCIESLQRNILVNGGLKGETNAAITKLILGKHGFHDKVDSTQAGPGGGPIEYTNMTDEELDRRIAALSDDEERED